MAIVAPGFWHRVNKTETCWLWTGSKTSAGYGDLNFMKQHVLAHRLAWTLENGEIEKGLLVLHRCDTPLCVRPDHLFLGTDADNNRDRGIKERTPRRKLTSDQVREIRELLPFVQQTKLASMFGVALSTIHGIKTRRSYKYV